MTGDAAPVELEQLAAELGRDLSGARLFFAPGRVNLIGEHTDYTGGLVLPFALEQGTWLALLPRKDDHFRLASSQFPGADAFPLAELSKQAACEAAWAEYPRGMITLLASEDLLPSSGFDLLYGGNLPVGAGLSSSASILVVTALALLAASGQQKSPYELARLAQRVENELLGVQSGIMDPLSIAAAKAGQAMLLHCGRVEWDYIPLRFTGSTLVVINSNRARALGESVYNQRRQETGQGLNQLEAQTTGIVDRTAIDLTIIDPSDWQRLRTAIDQPSRKRLEHVISENQRTRQAAGALRAGQQQELGQLMNASHRSLRKDFEVTGEHLDTLVDLAQTSEYCLGARMTGAGFGGCTINLVQKEGLDAFLDLVLNGYREATGIDATAFTAKAGPAAHEVHDFTSG